MKKAEKMLLAGGGLFAWSALAGEFISTNLYMPIPSVIYSCGLVGIIAFLASYTWIVISYNKGR